MNGTLALWYEPAATELANQDQAVAPTNAPSVDLGTESEDRKLLDEARSAIERDLATFHDSPDNPMMVRARDMLATLQLRGS